MLLLVGGGVCGVGVGGVGGVGGGVGVDVGVVVVVVNVVVVVKGWAELCHTGTFMARACLTVFVLVIFLIKKERKILQLLTSIS